MRRSLTAREWVLLALLGVLLLSCGYMLLFYMPQTEERDRCLEEAEAVRAQIQATQIRLEEQRRMEQELEDLFASDPPPLGIADYDNIKPILVELNSILTPTENYNLSFSTEDVSQSVVRRRISMNFTAGSYKSAKAVLQRLHDSAYRCMLDSLNLSFGESAEDSVTVNGTLVYFEYQAPSSKPAP